MIKPSTKRVVGDSSTGLLGAWHAKKYNLDPVSFSTSTHDVHAHMTCMYTADRQMGVKNFISPIIPTLDARASYCKGCLREERAAVPERLLKQRNSEASCGCGAGRKSIHVTRSQFTFEQQPLPLATKRSYRHKHAHTKTVLYRKSTLLTRAVKCSKVSQDI